MLRLRRATAVVRSVREYAALAQTVQRATASTLLARSDAGDAHGAYTRVYDSVSLRTGAGLFAAGAIAVGALTAGTSECEPAAPPEPAEHSEHNLISPERRKQMFFNYERNLRQRSSPDKIFEYFASVEKDGLTYMTAVDLMRTIVPVLQPFGSKSLRCGALRGENKEAIAASTVHSALFEKFIPDPFGLISYGEYIFFITLLSIPYRDIKAAFLMFDVDGSGALDADEFKTMMRSLRHRTRQGNVATDEQMLRTGLNVHGSVDSAGCSRVFFGKDGKGLLPMAKFESWLRELNEEMVKMEFQHYDSHQRKGKLDPRDFALSLISAACPKRMTTYLTRVATIPADIPTISLDEFMEFGRLRWRLDELKAAIALYGDAAGKLSPELFKRAVLRVCGIKLSDSVVRVVFHIFDDNGDGALSDDEFFAAYERHIHGDSKPAGKVDSLAGLMACCKDCYSQFHDR